MSPLLLILAWPVTAFLCVLPAATAEPAASTIEDTKGFSAFWDATRSELAAVPLEPSLEPDPAHTDSKAACFKASWRSLGRVLVHARYCRPTGDGPFPAVLINPWYSQGAIPPPRGLAERGAAALWYQARGFEVDRSSYPLSNSWYILEGLPSRETFVYRGIVSHGWRGLDFLSSRPEVDATRLAVMGASQGGGLSLILAGLDARVRFAAADFPFLSDWSTSMKGGKSLYGQVRKFIEERPTDRDETTLTLQLFDALSAADAIAVPTLVQLGLKDEKCPPPGIRRVFARLGSKDKKLVEYPDTGHEDRNAERWQAMEDWVVGRLRPLPSRR